MMEKHHSSLGSFKCPIKGCKGTSIRRDYLKEHLRRIHGMDAENARNSSYLSRRTGDITQFAKKNIDNDASEESGLFSKRIHVNIATPYSDLEEISSDSLNSDISDVDLHALNEITEEELQGISHDNNNNLEGKVVIDFDTNMQSIIDDAFCAKDNIEELIVSDDASCAKDDTEEQSVSDDASCAKNDIGEQSVSDNMSRADSDYIVSDDVSCANNDDDDDEQYVNDGLSSASNDYSNEDETNDVLSASNDENINVEHSELYIEDYEADDNMCSSDVYDDVDDTNSDTDDSEIEIIDISDEDEGQEIERHTLRTEVEVWTRTGYRYTTYRGEEPVFCRVEYEDDYHCYTMQ
jgi:hypothetical protein